MSSLSAIKKALVVVLLSCSAGLVAQTSPPPPATPAGADYNNRWDVSGGYWFTRMRPGFGHVAPVNLMGGGGQVTAWLKPAFGFSFAGRVFTGNAELQPNIYNLTKPSIQETVFLIGPDFRILKSPRGAVGAHALFGGTYGVFDNQLKGVQPNTVGLYSNQLAYAMAWGASFDYNLSPRLSIRATTDYQPTYFGATAQTSFAGSVSVVYKLGTLRHQQ